MRAKERYWLSGELDALEDAFEWLLQEAAAVGRGLLCVPQIGSLGRDIDDVVGLSVTEDLRRRKVALLAGGERLYLMTKRIRLARFDGPVLALMSDPKELDHVEEIEGASPVLVLPYLESDIQEWARLWAVPNLRCGDAPGQRVQVSPILTVALTSVQVLLGDRSLRSKDEQLLARTFERLRDASERVDPLEVKAWFLYQGLPPSYARAAARVAVSVLDGKRFSGPAWWRPDVVEQWREEARRL